MFGTAAPISSPIRPPSRARGGVGPRVAERRGSIRLGARKLDHLASLLSFVDHELPEVGGRAPNHHAAQVGKARLHLGIGESSVDLHVELVDDLGGRVLWRADAERSSHAATRTKSFSLDVCRPDDRPPLVDLGLLKGGKGLGRLLLARENFPT
jgi:hypothetical protein